MFFLCTLHILFTCLYKAAFNVVVSLPDKRDSEASPTVVDYSLVIVITAANPDVLQPCSILVKNKHDSQCR